jgi:hypothetical protein
VGVRGEGAAALGDGMAAVAVVIAVAAAVSVWGGGGDGVAVAVAGVVGVTVGGSGEGETAVVDILARERRVGKGVAASVWQPTNPIPNIQMRSKNPRSIDKGMAFVFLVIISEKIDIKLYARVDFQKTTIQKSAVFLKLARGFSGTNWIN